MTNNLNEEVIKIKNSFVSQTSFNDCGAACLCMILNNFNIKVTLEEIKKQLKIDKEGTSLYDIINLSKKYNLSATGYSNVKINEIKTPSIALVTNNNLQHFIVILNIYKDKILVADPSKNIMYLTKEEFKNIYLNVVLYFEKINKFNIIKKHKKNIIKLILLTFLYIITGIIFSYVLTYIISFTKLDKVYFIIILLILFSIIKEIIDLIRYKAAIKFQLLIDKDITRPILSKIITLPHKYYRDNSPGVIMSKINDLTYIKNMIFKFIEVIFINLIFIIISLIIILFFSYKLFILNLIYTIIIYILNKNYVKKNIYKSYEFQKESEQLNSILTDLLSSILMIKNLSKEKYFQNKILSLYDKLLNKYKKIKINYKKSNLIISIISSILLILSIFILKKYNYSSNNVLFLFSIEDIIISSYLQIISLSNEYSDFKNACFRINEIINYDNISSDEKININKINFKNINYQINNKKILNNVSFEINKNDFVMVTGDTGKGKSTLFKFLIKEYKYNKKGIKINNLDILNIDEYKLKNSIMYVDQKLKLFNLSIRENIFLGGKYDSIPLECSLLKKTLDEKKLSLDDYVDNLNSNLSGGEISKVVIAQALNTNKDVIIFDETTESLDIKTERDILLNIKEFYKNKIIIFITHRNSNMDLYNKVITIK